MSGSGPNAEGLSYSPSGTTFYPTIDPDDIDTLEAEGREDFLLAVDNAYRSLHRRNLDRLRRLMADMDRLTAVVVRDPELIDLVTCWRDMRLVLNLIDIESETTP